MTAPLALFDLDGTLVDSARDLIPALNATIVPEGLDAVDTTEASKVIGHGARAMIERALVLNHKTADAEAVDRLFVHLLAHYEARISKETRPFPGTVALLDRLAGAGWCLAVCTNKTEHLSRLLLEQLGLADRFATICGGDTFPVRKPDAGHIDGTIAKAGGRADRALMIGDSVTDRDAARNAGLAFVGVTFGYSDIPIASLEPDLLVNHFDEIGPEALSRLLV